MSVILKNITVGCIGCGNMGGALIRPMAKIIPVSNITVSAGHAEKAFAFAKSCGVNAAETNKEAAKTDIVLLAVKPVKVASVLKEIASSLSAKTIVVSMAAGVTLETLRASAGAKCKAHFIRIMPNMPAAVCKGMIALSCGDDVTAEQLETATALLSVAGLVEKVDEKLMDCVTAVSGSGPAFVFMFIEAMADAAVRCGMPRVQAYTYAAQTVYGSAAMALTDGRTPAQLKDAVCSPAGTTIEGVAALEKDGLRNAVIDAVTAACAKSASLGKR
jgi:pyrroline-5-carboxylate reductase